MEPRQTKTSPAKKKSRKAWYINRVSECRCVRCGAIDDRTRNGGVRCAECNAKSHVSKAKPLSDEQRNQKNAEKREWDQRMKSAHLCVKCGKMDARTVNGKSHCLQCAKALAKRKRDNWDFEHEKEVRDTRRANWIAAGMCSTCGRPKEEPERAMCLSCRVKAKMRNEKRKIKLGILPRGINGICFQCNKKKAIEGKKLCQECYDKRVAALAEVRRKRKEAREHEKANATGVDRGHPCQVP